MKGIVRGICGLALVAALVVLPSAGALGDAPKPILMYPEGESPGRFSPKQFTARLDAGAPEAVWKQAPGETQPHNVISDRHLFESPFIDGSYKLQLSAGSYPYFCSLHGTRTRGMRGTISVPPKVKRLSASRAKVTWATPNSESGDRFDVDWRRKGSGKWRHWKQGTAALQATFGAGNTPTDVAPAKRYQVRVRSFDGRKANRRSGFSPPATIPPN